MLNDAPFHPTLAVRDLAPARDWWFEKVGWEPIAEPPGTLVYEVGDSNFTLFETPNAGTAQNTVMNWNVADVLAEVARLKANGVAFEEYDFGEYRTVDGIMTDPTGGRTAWFKDPDGNTVAILQAPAGQGSSHALSGMLAASDLDRARAWYAAKLGLTPVAEFAGMVLDFATGGTSFNVYRTEFAGTAKNTVGIWRLEGLVPEVERLRERGVVFDEYEVDPGEHYVDGILFDDEGPANAWFTDSEGNILALAQDRGGTSAPE
jgi:catechol 2,3-dioxygenase-like lactoylglutathione lyase family enzyme